MVSGTIARFFGIDDPFVRQAPPRPWRTDWIIGAFLTLISLATVMYARDLSPETAEYLPLGPSVGVIVLAGALISLRRQFPLAILLLVSGAHFIVVGVTLPMVASSAGMQVLYFLGIYTAMAYARNRQSLALTIGAVLLAMVVWLVSFDSYARATMPDEFRPSFWYYLGTTVLNFAYFGGAIWLGRQAWLQARLTAQLTASQELVTAQATQLAEQAVVTERLRIARDLHDSVAHHISLIGVQTAAARRAMGSRPEAAGEAMQGVEEMSRQAVAELRTVLGSLRDVAGDGGATSLAGVAALADDPGPGALRVSYQLVGEESPEAVVTPVQAGQLLRIAQESLANVRRHSTATEARVVVRLGDRVELEITDNGLPIAGTQGTGLGHVGIRERVASLGGQVELGPRSTQGYRVRVTLPRKVGP